MDRLFYLLAALLLLRQAESTKWEFGQLTPGQEFIDHSRGKISPLETLTMVYIHEPKCMKIKYVAVEVFNNISTPTVTFNKKTSTVSILYKDFQIAQSEYDIKTMAGRIKGCKSTSASLEDDGEGFAPGSGRRDPGGGSNQGGADHCGLRGGNGGGDGNNQGGGGQGGSGVGGDGHNQGGGGFIKGGNNQGGGDRRGGGGGGFNQRVGEYQDGVGLDGDESYNLE